MNDRPLGRAKAVLGKKKGDGDYGNVDVVFEDERDYHTLQERDQFYTEAVADFTARMEVIFGKRKN